jgi:hypothetical protein
LRAARQTDGAARIETEYAQRARLLARVAGGGAQRMVRGPDRAVLNTRSDRIAVCEWGGQSGPMSGNASINA